MLLRRFEYLPTVNVVYQRFRFSTVPKKCIKKDERIEQMYIEKFRKVSDSVWASFEAMVVEKTVKEK